MSRVPRLSPGVDIKSLPLKPAEAFLLSRIDGIVDERELGLITGLSGDSVETGVNRLLELGAVTVEPPLRISQVTPIGLRPLTPPTTTSSKPPPSQSHSYGRPVESAGSPPLYDPAELDEAVELDQDRKRKILDLFYRLDEINYYELLGISEQAEKKQIKSAYYVLAPEFHPDKFFRKNLGSFKAKIEAVFARFTLAHDVLTSKEKRPEYDGYLEQTHRNRAMSALLDQSQRDIAAVTSAVEESAKAILATGAPGVSSPPPTPGRYVQEPQRPESAQSRRDTFARKLAGGAKRGAGQPARPSGAPPGTSTAPPSSVTPPSAPAASGAALMARYEAARAEAERQQIARYIENARSALDRKDYAAAANAYRIAASLAPKDAAIQTAAAETAKLAAKALAEGFLKQAHYEAQNGRWQEASLSYGKVCAGRPDDASAHERAAFAMIQAGGSTRRAVEFARRAVELGPTIPDMHLTLARAFLAAGLEKSAQAEIDRALELAPKDARVKELAERLKSERPKDGKVG